MLRSSRPVLNGQVYGNEEKVHHGCGGLFGAALCGFSPSQASPVNATAPIASFNVDLLDGTDLSNTIGLDLDLGVTTAHGAGNLLPVPAVTKVVINGPLYLYSALGL